MSAMNHGSASRDPSVPTYNKDEDIPFGNDPKYRDPKIDPRSDVYWAVGVKEPWINPTVEAVRKVIPVPVKPQQPLENSKAICQREVKIMSAARHSHVVKVIHSYFYIPEGQSVMSFCIIMERANKGEPDLSGHLCSDKLQLRWIGCLINVVAHIHDLGIRHRDIKPKNVLVKQGEVFLADFGTAHMSLGKTMKTTREGWSKGRSPPYCAPEVDVNNGQSRGRSADIFSMGAVILEMLLSHSYDAMYDNLQKITTSDHDDYGYPIRSFGKKLQDVLALVDNLSGPGSRDATATPQAQWRIEILRLCKKMLDKERDLRPSAKDIKTCWKKLMDGPGAAEGLPLECETCKIGSTDATKEGRLIAACKEHHEGVIERLLFTEKADPNTKGAIHQLAVAGLSSDISLFLRAGVNVNTQDYAGQTALHYAAMFGRDEVAKMLLSAGADVTIIDVEGQTALHCAAANGCKPVLEKLLAQKNTDVKLEDGTVVKLVDAPDKDRLTPLHYAARANKLDAVEILMASGADSTLTTGGKTALHIAQARAKRHPKEFAKVVKALERGPKKNSKWCFGRG